MIDLTKNLATVNRRTKSSVIRELLKLTNDPRIISFAGGLPSPDAFPLEHLGDIAEHVIKTMGHQAFQYGPTEGLPELKEQIIHMLRREEGLEIRPQNLLITTASQQSLDLVGKAFIDPSDPILVELPSYVGGLQVFGSYGARMIGIHSDDHGILMDDFEKKLALLRKEEEHYKFMYLIPDFQNPSGVTIPRDRRERIVKLAEEYNIVIIEDSPYRQVRFEGEAPPMIYKLDKSRNVVSLFTFSKTLVPGFRLGYIVADEAIIKRLAVLKQSVDLCTSPFTQLLATEYLKRGLFEAHLPKIVSSYRKKRDAMLAALTKYMPDGVTWTKPEGGLFLWVKLPASIDADTMFYEAVEEFVAYVVGSAFHCDGSGHNTMRLNFSYSTEEQIDEGMKRLANVIKKKLKK